MGNSQAEEKGRVVEEGANLGVSLGPDCRCVSAGEAFTVLVGFWVGMAPGGYLLGLRGRLKLLLL